MSSFSIVRSIFILTAIITHSYFCPGQDISSSRLILSEEHFKVPFIWKGDSINGQWENYAAMLIPVKLAGCPKQFYMQFDAGAPHSLFYKNKLKAISSRYPLTQQITDSTATLDQFSFNAGKTRIQGEKILLKDLGTTEINWHKNAIEIIGTLGTDFIGNETVLINYPGKNISIGYKIPENSALKLTDFIYVNRSIILPASLRGKKTMLFFDSGSSAFELLTNKETATRLAMPTAIPVSYPVTSWGKIVTANSYASIDSVEMASVKIPLNNGNLYGGHQ